MKTPLLTFCIPTYNRSCYLAEALQRLTVSLQEVKEYYSIIISDNNSTDDTYEIVSKYKLKLNIKYIKQKENMKMT